MRLLNLVFEDESRFLSLLVPRCDRTSAQAADVPHFSWQETLDALPCQVCSLLFLECFAFIWGMRSPYYSYLQVEVLHIGKWAYLEHLWYAIEVLEAAQPLFAAMDPHGNLPAWARKAAAFAIKALGFSALRYVLFT